jgi:hypothetical protein
MDEAFKKTFYKTVWRLLVICMLMQWGVLAIYFYKFAPGNWFELSESHEIWAHFATFYSGLLGPFLGFVAFLGVLITVVLQMRQFDHLKQQADVQEMQRAMAGISVQLDDMLRVVPTYYEAKAHIKGEAAPLTLFNNIAAVALQRLDRKSQGNQLPQSGVDAVMADIQLSVNAVGIELHVLSWSLNEFQKLGGSKTMVEFYKLRYGALIGYLEILGVMTSTSMVRKMFDVEMLKRVISGEQAPA